nr:MAG TPA: stabilization protein [Caudoviricetes sp.]
MPIFHTQNVLNGGEISPLLRGRVDQPRYNTGTREMLNFVPMPQGGVTRRPGTRYLGTAKSQTSRLIPFVFSETQGRILEFGDKTMRVWLPDGRLVSSGSEPYVVSTPFAASDLRAVRFAQSADVVYFVHQSYPPCKLSRYSDNDWRWTTLTFMPSIAAPQQPALQILDKRADDDKPKNPSRTDYSYLVTAIDGETGEESSASPAATIEAEALNSVDYHIRITWPAVSGASEYRIYKKKTGVFGFIGRASADDTTTATTTLQGIDIGGYRFSRTADDLFVSVLTQSIEKPDGTTTTVVTGVKVGKTGVFVPQTYPAWYNASLQKLFVYHGKDEQGVPVGWIGVDNVPSGYEGEYGSFTSYTGFGQNSEYHQGFQGDIQANPVFSYSYAQYYDDKNIGADTEDTPIEHKNPFEGSGNYPSQVFFHQQRLGFAATANRPITFWLSRTGDFESMASSVPPKDDDAIEVTLAATQANRIVWLQPDRNALAFGTEGSEWTLQSSEGVVLTPSTVSFQIQTTNGGEGAVSALSVGGGVLYVQRGSGAVREFAYNYSADKYLGQDLTILARHIIKDRDITAWAYQQEPYSTLWCVLSDCTFAGLTYMKEQDVIGWHRHTTDGSILDVAVIPGTPDDQVWFLVRRTAGVFIERLESFFDSDNLDDAFFLDSALHYSGEAADTFSGLGHLSGRTVQVFADGGTIDGLTVSAGGELKLKSPAKSVHIGLPYTSRVIPNLPEVQTQQGWTLMHNRKISAVRVRTYRSMSFLAGIAGNLSTIVDRHIKGGAFSVRPFFSDGTDLNMETCGGWSSESPLVFEVSSATPLTILAIVTTMDIAPYAGGGML